MSNLLSLVPPMLAIVKLEELWNVLESTVIFVALGCRSCETIDSSKLDPSEIYQEYTVSADSKTSWATTPQSGSSGSW